MDTSRDEAQKLWRQRYGSSQEVKDFAGRTMVFSRHESTFAKGTLISSAGLVGGWNLHHVHPKADDGGSNKENIAITNVITNDDAADKNTFVTNESEFQVRKIKGTTYYGIARIDVDPRIWVFNVPQKIY